MEYQDEIDEILENNHIEDYNPDCATCQHWKRLSGSEIGECNSDKFALNPVYTKSKGFFCSDYFYKKHKKKK